MKQWVAELSRRKVFRVASAYIIVAWALIQVAETTFLPMGLPGWTLKLVIWLLILGFPLACALAWAYDVTPKGVERTPASQTHENGSPPEPANTVFSPLAGTGVPPLTQERMSSLPEIVADTKSLHSVAILPFVNMSSDRDQDYFCDGIAEEIINALCCVRGLRVASRTSSFQFKNQAADVREIGRKLGVGSVLEGSVRQAGDRVRITAQLLNASDGYHFWSQSYDRTLDDVFEIQTDIAKRLVDALQVTLRPGEGELLGRGGTRNARAYDFFLRGQQQLYAYRDGSEAAEMFRQAVAHDDQFAQAQAGLASALAVQWSTGKSLTPADFSEALAASRRALELEPWMPEAVLARAQLMSAQRRNEDAERDFKEAVRLNPTSYFTYYAYGRHCLAMGQVEQAGELFRASARLAPEEYTPLGMLSFALQKLGRDDESREVMIKALQLIERYLQEHPDDEAALGRGAIMAARLGQQARATEYAERAVRVSPNSYTGLYNAACTFAIMGDNDRAIALLEQATRNASGNMTWLENDSDFINLRQDPRFIVILERMRAASG